MDLVQHPTEDLEAELARRQEDATAWAKPIKDTSGNAMEVSMSIAKALRATAAAVEAGIPSNGEGPNRPVPSSQLSKAARLTFELAYRCVAGGAMDHGWATEGAPRFSDRIENHKARSAFSEDILRVLVPELPKYKQLYELKSGKDIKALGDFDRAY